MTSALDFDCPQHAEAAEFPDAPVTYVPKFDEYGLLIHDGGSSFVTIQYCPWCGAKLPESKRARWFDELENQGIDPWGSEVPEKYKSDDWHRADPEATRCDSTGPE